MLSIVLSLLFHYLFFAPIRISGKWTKFICEATQHWSGWFTCTRAELYDCSQLGYIGCSLAGLISLLDLPHPVVDTSVNLIYFFMWIWKFCNFSPVLQFEFAWALINIASSKAVVGAAAVARFIYLWACLIQLWILW
jgi:hypothetical protein